MELATCLRCEWPSRRVNEAGLCDRCWRGPDLMEHGPETLEQHELRQRRESREEERRAKQKEERVRKHAADCIHNYRLCCGFTQWHINEAEAMDSRGENSSGRWLEAAKRCAEVAAKALYIASIIPPSHSRTWERRAASCADTGAECARRAAKELRRALRARNGASGLEVVVGGGEVASSARPSLRLVGKAVE